MSAESPAERPQAAPSPLSGTREEVADLRRASAHWPSWELTGGQCAELEMLVSGACHPLSGPMDSRQAGSVAREARLPNGAYWPLPLVWSAPAATARAAEPGQFLALRDPEGTLLGALRVEEVWQPDAPGGWAIGGRVQGLGQPFPGPFPELRGWPRESRARIAAAGWGPVLAWRPTDPLTLAGARDLTAALAEDGAGALVFLEQPDPEPAAILRWRAVWTSLEAVPADRLRPVLLPVGRLPPRLLPVVARNHGATHLVLPPAERAELQPTDLLRGGLECLAQVPPWWPPRLGSGAPGASATGVYAPAVRSWLERSLRPAGRAGLTVFFTGLSGSGKSTVARHLRHRLLLETGRPVTLLDGDLVRRHLSSELGFSREHRELNIRRIGFVAAEITRHGGIAVCCPIAPHDATRREVRATVEAAGRFLLVHVDTPLEVCEARDVKGLYARARAGQLAEFTGISSPYEPPTDADLVLDTSREDPAACTDRVLAELRRRGWLE